MGKGGTHRREDSGHPRLPVLRRAGRRGHLGAAAAAASGERLERLRPWSVGKVALFLRPGQAGAQPRGGGHSARPGVHGQRESSAGAALQATGLFILRAERLRLEALSPAPEVSRDTRAELGKRPAHPVSQTQGTLVNLGNYNSQEATRQRCRRRLHKRHRRRERWGRVLDDNWSRASTASGPAEKGRQELSLQTSFLRLVAAAETSWISASWKETIRAAVA